GGGGCGRAWTRSEDRGGRAAIHRAIENAREHDDPEGGIEPEGQWEQERHAGKRSKSRQYADHGSPEATEEAVKESLPGKRDGKSANEVIEPRHLTTVPPEAARQAALERKPSRRCCRSRSPGLPRAEKSLRSG